MLQDIVSAKFTGRYMAVLLGNLLGSIPKQLQLEADFGEEDCHPSSMSAQCTHAIASQRSFELGGRSDEDRQCDDILHKKTKKKKGLNPRGETQRP